VDGWVWSWVQVQQRYLGVHPTSRRGGQGVGWLHQQIPNGYGWIPPGADSVMGPEDPFIIREEGEADEWMASTLGHPSCLE